MDGEVSDDKLTENMGISEWAGFVGFEFPVLFRVYAGYIFSATGKSETSNGDYELKNGTGAKFGLGFTGLPFIDINFEYRRGTFKEYELAGTKYDDEESTYSAFMVGLSLPLNL
jgi:hypothetical protein